MNERGDCREKPLFKRLDKCTTVNKEIEIVLNLQKEISFFKESLVDFDFKRKLIQFKEFFSNEEKKW